MDWPLTLLPEVEKPRKTGVRRGCNLALNAEAEDGLRGGRPSFCQPEPASFSGPPQATACRVFFDEAHVGVRRVGRPVVMEVFQEVLPVAGEPVLLKVGEGEREGVVDADERGDVRREFLARP